MILVVEDPHIPAKGFININAERGQSRFLAKSHNTWRQIGFMLAKKAGVRHIPTPVVITASFRFPTNAVRDSSNLFPTIKHLVDGVVDAGALVADDDRHVSSTNLRREWPNGPLRLTLRIETEAPNVP